MNIQRSNLNSSPLRKGLSWFAALIGVAILSVLVACPAASSGGGNGDTAAPTGWTIEAVESTTTAGAITITLDNSAGSETITGARFAIYRGAAPTSDAPANYDALVAALGTADPDRADDGLAQVGTFSLTDGMLATTGANTITVDSSVLVDDVGAPGYIVYVAVTDGTNGSVVVSEAGVVTATPPPGSDSTPPSGWTIAAVESAATAGAITITLDNSAGSEAITGARFAIYRGAAPTSGAPADYDVLVATLGTADPDRADAGLAQVDTFSLTDGMLATTGANTITVDSDVLVDDVGAPGYIVYVAVTDGTNGSAVQSVAGVVTSDTAGPPTTGTVTAQAFGIGASQAFEFTFAALSKDATIHWAVLTDGTAAPIDADTLKALVAGTPASTIGAGESTSVVVAGTDATYRTPAITVAISTDYDLFIVATDSADQDSAISTKIEATTNGAAAVVPTITNAGAKTPTATGFTVEYDLDGSGVTTADVYWVVQLASADDIDDDSDGFVAVRDATVNGCHCGSR